MKKSALRKSKSVDDGKRGGGAVLRKSKTVDDGKRGGGGPKIKSQFTMNADMDHNADTATTLAIAGAIASGDETSKDFFVLLTIKNARNLQPMNTNRQSDPYCVIRYLNVERKTRKFKNTLNPDFDQHFFFKAPSQTDVERAEEAKSSFTNPHAITVYVMDDEFGFKDNVQGHVTVRLPTVDQKFCHVDYDDIALEAAEYGGSYKELEMLKTSWFERKLKRKLAKSTGPGSLGTLSAGVTVFAADILKAALRTESRRASTVSTPASLPDAAALPDAGALSAEAADAIVKSVRARTAVALSTQKQLHEAFLATRPLSNQGWGRPGGSGAGAGAGAASESESGSGVAEAGESFENAVKRVMGDAEVKLAASQSVNTTATHPDDGAAAIAIAGETAKDIIEEQRRFLLNLHVSMEEYVDEQVQEALDEEAKARLQVQQRLGEEQQHRRELEDKLQTALLQLKRTMVVLRDQAEKVVAPEPPQPRSPSGSGQAASTTN